MEFVLNVITINQHKLYKAQIKMGNYQPSLFDSLPSKFINFKQKIICIMKQKYKNLLPDKANKGYASIHSNKLKQQSQNFQEFSFSEDKPESSIKISPKNPSINKILHKKLFNDGQPPKSLYIKQRLKSKSSSPQKKISPKKVSSPSKNISPHQSYQTGQKLYKNSVQKIKRKMFNTDSKNREYTKRTLQLIGREAEKRQQQLRRKKEKQSNSLKFKSEPIKRTIYLPVSGDNSVGRRQDNVINHENNQIYRSKHESSYLNFLKNYSKVLEQNQNKSYQERQVEDDQLYEPRQIKESNLYHESPDEINEEQIDTICEIFDLCQKGYENSMLMIEDFHKLMEQLERLYFIKVIQQTQQQRQLSKSRWINQKEYYFILEEFQSNFKIIFYRKDSHDIFDALFYLSESRRLHKVCSQFHKIKNFLEI